MIKQQTVLINRTSTRNVGVMLRLARQQLIPTFNKFHRTPMDKKNQFKSTIKRVQQGPYGTYVTLKW